MQCKTCEYYLWGVRDRYCPECHTLFSPSQFEFVPNTVRFCCPHCNQAYYGTGEKGHLSPRHFLCVTCGRPVDMDEMVLFPADGVDVEQTQVERMPWLDRKRQGAVKAWLRTIGMAMTSPSRLIRMTPLQAPNGQAWLFAIVSNLLFMIMGMLPFVVMPLLMFRRSPFAIFGGCGLLIPLLMFMIGLAIWAVFAHVILKITGETAGASGRTLQALCYGSAANVLTAVPCLGPYLSPVSMIWTAISATLMVREGQKVHGARAAVAVLTFPVLMVALLVGGIYWVYLQVRSVPVTYLSNSNVAVLDHGVLQYAEMNGPAPQHAIELLDNGSVSAVNFVSVPGTESTVTIGATTLAQFENMQPPQAAVVVQAAIKSLPPGVIAHRLGDYVFTYHGINLKSPDPRLWLVVSPPNPNAPTATSPRRRMMAGAQSLFVIGRADGTVVSYPVTQFPAELAKQNTLRARYGLAPLPDPSTVTQAKPAVGAPTPSSAPAGGAATSASAGVPSTQPQATGARIIPIEPGYAGTKVNTAIFRHHAVFSPVAVSS